MFTSHVPREEGPRPLSRTLGPWTGSLSTLNITLLLKCALGLPLELHGAEGRPVAVRGPLVVAQFTHVLASWLQAPGKSGQPPNPRQQALSAQPIAQVKTLRPRADTTCPRSHSQQERCPAPDLCPPAHADRGDTWKAKSCVLPRASGRQVFVPSVKRGRDTGQCFHHLRERRPL